MTKVCTKITKKIGNKAIRNLLNEFGYIEKESWNNNIKAIKNGKNYIIHFSAFTNELDSTEKVAIEYNMLENILAKYNDCIPCLAMIYINTVDDYYNADIKMWYFDDILDGKLINEDGSINRHINIKSEDKTDFYNNKNEDKLKYHRGKLRKKTPLLEEMVIKEIRI